MTPRHPPSTPPRPPGRRLIPASAIRRRTRELAAEIRAHYAGKPLTIVGLLNGAVFFMVDLVRHLDLPDPMLLECWRVRSYEGTASTGRVEGLEHVPGDFRGRHVLVLDDILDTGVTLDSVCRRVRGLGARSVRVCVLLRKDRPRAKGVRAHWVAFDIPDLFVIGYGLDHDGHHRHLPDIRVLGGG